MNGLSHLRKLFIYFQVFRVSLVQSEEEKDSHKLEVEHAKLLIRKMNDKENAAIGANNYGNYFVIRVIFLQKHQGFQKEENIQRILKVCPSHE